jgi:hypothetical protein
MPSGSTMTTTLVPGTTWVPADAATDSKLNLTANPTVQVSGNSRQLTDFSSGVPAEGYALVFRAATGYWTPEPFPASASDVPNRIFMWKQFG